jgi:hypothetical protein
MIAEWKFDGRKCLTFIFASQEEQFSTQKKIASIGVGATEFYS